MTLADAPLLALAALLIELCLGYPAALFQRIGHPVTWIGAFIDWADRSFNHDDHGRERRRERGTFLLGTLIVGSLLIGALLQGLLGGTILGFLLLALATSSLLAQRSLDSHVADVAEALQEGLEPGRASVGKIVGRNPAALDEAGVARAAIESLAENFSDGVVAPVLWTALLGLPGGLAYKAVNTADSMIGHRSDRHRDFGRASAKFDDLINLPASRLSAVLIVSAAALVPGASPLGAIRAVRRDARHHRSPNAGWPEAAMAGALGLALNGPRVYGDTLVDDAMMGDGRRDAGPGDILRALRLYRTALGIEAILVALLVAGVLALA